MPIIKRQMIWAGNFNQLIYKTGNIFISNQNANQNELSFLFNKVDINLKELNVQYVWEHKHSWMCWWEQFDTIYLNIRCADPFNYTVHLCELLLKRIRQLPMDIHIYVRIYIYTHTYFSLFMIKINLNNLKYLLMGEYLNLGCIQSLEHYTTIKVIKHVNILGI